MKHIADKELRLTKENDLLGTYPYALNISEFIRSTLKDDENEPLNIGLFGYWGAGKSSILSAVKELLSDEPAIHFTTYDAWKYSNDDFRRSFLMEIETKMGLINECSIAKYYRDVKEDAEVKMGLAKPEAWLIGGVASLILLVSYFKGMELGAVITLLSGLLFVLASKSIVLKRTQSTANKIFSSEQFVDHFKDILRRFANPVVKKHVFVIDNIDRCSKEIVMDLLMEIKNFLNRKNTIFIIPCDDVSVKEYLNSNNDFGHGNELFRKIFNIQIRIKRYINRDLFDYASELLCREKYSFPKSSYPVIASMVSKGFSSNPRRVVYFLNNLQLEYDLLEEIIKSNKISHDIDVAFLSKIQIIKEEWYDLYELISYDLRNLEIIENGIINANKNISAKSMSWPTRLNTIVEAEQLILDEEQYKFFKSTSHITTKNIEIYFRLKTNDPSRDFDVITNLEKYKDISISDLTVLYKEQLELCIYERRTEEVDGPLIINAFIEFYSSLNLDAIDEDDENEIRKVLNYIDKISEYINWDKVSLESMEKVFVKFHHITRNERWFNCWTRWVDDKIYEFAEVHMKHLINVAESTSYSLAHLKNSYTKLLFDESSPHRIPESLSRLAGTKTGAELIAIDQVIDYVKGETLGMVAEGHLKVRRILEVGLKDAAIIDTYIDNLSRSIDLHISKDLILRDLSFYLVYVLEYVEPEMRERIENMFNLIYANPNVKNAVLKDSSQNSQGDSASVGSYFGKYLKYLLDNCDGLICDLSFQMLVEMNVRGRYSDLSFKILKRHLTCLVIDGENSLIVSILINNLKKVSGGSQYEIVRSLMYSVENSFDNGKVGDLSQASLNLLLVHSIDIYLEKEKPVNRFEESVKRVAANHGNLAQVEAGIKRYLNSIEEERNVASAIGLSSFDFVAGQIEQLLRRNMSQASISETGLRHFSERSYPKQMKVEILKEIYQNNTFGKDKRCELLAKEIKLYS